MPVSRLTIFFAALSSAVCLEAAEPAARPPNIVLIVADDLGYGELGSYGQRDIRTPHLDQLAAEGVRFTRFYSGAPVCAPARSTLLTGLHTGHTRVRDNGEIPLEAGDAVLPLALQAAGYRTGIIGKWGLGDQGSTGVPWQQGFDEFYGVLHHHHAHNYFPEFLYRGAVREPLRNRYAATHLTMPDKPVSYLWSGTSEVRWDYAPDFFDREAVAFIERNRQRPFFLYYALTLPHANSQARDGLEVRDEGEYIDRDWPEHWRRRAAMTTRLDESVGRLLEALRRHSLEANTLVLFTSDNGPSREGGAGDSVDRFALAGGLRGGKSTLYEGGIRVPLVVRLPGRVSRGRVVETPGAFWDLPATIADATGAPVPAGDGASLWTLLCGQADAVPPADRSLLFYYQGGAGSRAAVSGDWKYIETPEVGRALYNLREDPAEKRDLSSDNSALASSLRDVLDKNYVPSPRWPRDPRPIAQTH